MHVRYVFDRQAASVSGGAQRSEAESLPLLAATKWHEHGTSGAWDDPAADLVVAMVTATAGVEVTHAETPNALYRALMTTRHSNEDHEE